MAIAWNAEADTKLLVGIIVTSNASIDFEKVAEFMGQDCTVSALKHRIQRIKEKAGLTSKSAAPKSPSTPKTKRSTTMKATKSTSKRKSTVPKDTEQTGETLVESEPEDFDQDGDLA